LELYFEYYLNEVEKLIHQGLIKRYRKNTGNVIALKGKLEFAGNIRHNLVHRERFYTTHQVYDRDHLLHQVLLNALDIVHHFSRGTRLGDKSGRVKLAFPEVKEIRPTAALLEQIHLDRKTAPYERALELAKLIILNYSPDIQTGQNKMISLLFDMNQLWEEFVIVQLKKHLSNSEWIVHGQQSKPFHGSWRTIRPDIVLTKGEEIFIIDTKWKRPANNAASIEELRQMYAYGRFWQAEKMMLLYPGNRDQSGKYIEYRNSASDNKVHLCKVGFVSVLEGNCLNENLAGEIVTLIQTIKL
jgi:5-methylcytosine-specific restriction enzyme subunit McrC